VKAATIYERRGQLYIHSSSRTTVGVWVINPPVLSTSKGNLGEIGQSIRESFAASYEGVPHPKIWKGLFDPVLDLAGVKSSKEFQEAAKCVEVRTADGKSVEFFPSRNEYPGRGFTPLSNTLEVTVDSDEALGSAALLALEMSE
jgi:hypothetical protein